MEMPVQLDIAVKDARQRLREHPKNELILPARKRIWLAMGSAEILEEGNRAVITPALRRRTMLALSATEYALPVWDSLWPNDKRPQEMLALAQQYLRKEMEWKATWQLQNKFLGALENFGKLPLGQIHVAYVGFASALTVLVALKDEWMDDLEALDQDQDSWDAAFYACGAYAGDFPWGTNWNSAKALEFWEWYLDVAVPKAYASAE